MKSKYAVTTQTCVRKKEKAYCSGRLYLARCPREHVFGSLAYILATAPI